MKRRLASWLMWREERWLWVPERARDWAWNYTFEHGTPVEIAVRLKPRVAAPFMEINPPVRTWTTTSWPAPADRPEGETQEEQL